MNFKNKVMAHIKFISLLAATIVLLLPGMCGGQDNNEDTLRIIAFGAHPDDCELNTAGVASLWAAEGHEFKCVSITNGDVGHFGMSGGELAVRRLQEARDAAVILGISTEVLDIHDGELIPSLEYRRQVTRLIREWQADIVMVHRRYDYHPDHRYSGVLIDDTIPLVQARFFASDTPHLQQSPILLYYYDRFEKPIPFEPDIVVGIDDVWETKRSALSRMPSQFSDAESWTWGNRENIPEDESERMELRLNEIESRFENQADLYRERLIELYGEETGRNIQYAESFELSEYGRQVDEEELKQLFPTFD